MSSTPTLRRPLGSPFAAAAGRIVGRINASDAQLILAALTIAVVFGVFFVVPQPLWNGHASGPHTPSADGLEPAMALLALAYAAAWALPFRPFIGALQAIQHGASTRVVIGLTAVLAVVALLIYPAFGSDVFVYAAYGRLFATYGEHPLLGVPAMHPGDWTYAYVWFPYQPSPYGPLWALIGGAIALVSDTSAALVVAGYKLVALLGYVGCCALVWSLAPLERRAYALVAFAWSPLVLFEVLGKAHNDILLALAVLLAVRFSPRAAGLAAITVGGVVKLSALAAWPAFAADLVRQRRWAALLLGTTASAAALVLAYLPFWQGPETLLPVLAQTSRVVWSPGSLLIALGLDVTITRLLLAAGCLVLSLVVVIRVKHVVDAAALLLLVAMLLLTTAFFAHYLVPVIALAALSSNQRLNRLVLALSIGSLVAYATDMLPGDFHVLGSLVLLLPAIAVTRKSSRPQQAQPD